MLRKWLQPGLVQSLQWVNMGWMTSMQEQGIFSLSPCPDCLCGSHRLLFCVHCRYSGWNGQLSLHFHLVSRCRMHGVITPFHFIHFGCLYTSNALYFGQTSDRWHVCHSNWTTYRNLTDKSSKKFYVCLPYCFIKVTLESTCHYL